MICNPSKSKEIIFRKEGFIQDIAQVNNIPQCTKLPILGVTFQENCKYSEHVRAKLIKANKCLFELRSLRKEGFSQGKVGHLFSTLVFQISLMVCLFMALQTQILRSYKTLWTDTLKGNTYLREWKFENF